MSHIDDEDDPTKPTTETTKWCQYAADIHSAQNPLPKVMSLAELCAKLTEYRLKMHNQNLACLNGIGLNPGILKQVTEEGREFIQEWTFEELHGSAISEEVAECLAGKTHAAMHPALNAQVSSVIPEGANGIRSLYARLVYLHFVIDTEEVTDRQIGLYLNLFDVEIKQAMTNLRRMEWYTNRMLSDELVQHHVKNGCAPSKDELGAWPIYIQLKQLNSQLAQRFMDASLLSDELVQYHVKNGRAPSKDELGAWPIYIRLKQLNSQLAQRFMDAPLPEISAAEQSGHAESPDPDERTPPHKRTRSEWDSDQ